jgi:hypothetical protein
VPTFQEITRHHDPDPSADPWVIGPPAPGTVTIVAYNPVWPRRYQAHERQPASSVTVAEGSPVSYPGGYPYPDGLIGWRGC